MTSYTNVKREKEENEKKGKQISKRIKSVWKTFYSLYFH